MNSCIINHRPISSSYSLSVALWRRLPNKNPITLASLRPVGPVRVRDGINSAAGTFQLLEAAWTCILCVSPTCQRSAGCCLLQQRCMFACTGFCRSTNYLVLTGGSHDRFLMGYRILKTARPITISCLCILKKFITCSFCTAEGEKGWDGWVNIR